MYERLLPGAADRILTMAERQAEHRQALETASLTSDSIARDNQIDVERNRIEGVIFNERLGQFFGFAVAVGCVGFAGWGMMNGASATVIGLFLGLPIAGVIKAFINGRQGHPKPRAEKS
ncbi:TPA: DUF2335 domain-containing protein [Burkholderia vietnamiensis]|nr:DUF2335 domain-containing protein [Burkholderia vietnamiensis]